MARGEIKSSQDVFCHEVFHFQTGLVAEPSDEPTVFAPLVMCEPEPPQAPGPSDGSLRLIFGDVTIELAATTPAVRIAEIVHALGAPS